MSALETLLKDKVAIITGAGKGIGKATAKLFAQAGASVVLASRTAADINAVAAEIKAAGGQALAIPTDVTNLANIDHLVILTLRAFRHIDILVNNAAVIQPIGKAWEVDPIAWQQLIHTNLIGPFLCTRAVLPHMLDRGDGHIINVTSGAAYSDIVGWSAYCASKAALDRFTTILAQEVSDTEIVVCGMSPGATDTPMQAEIRNISKTTFPLVDHFRQRFEAGTLTTPEDAARLNLWLTTRTDQNGVIAPITDKSIREHLAELPR